MDKKTKNWKRYLTGGTSVFIGFILSPLSWWNDLIINIPIAYFFAYITGKVLDIFLDVSTSFYISIFIFWYFISNVLGMLMIHYGSKSFRKNPKKKKAGLLGNIAIALLYTGLIIVFSYLDIFNIIPENTIIPSWVK